VFFDNGKADGQTQACPFAYSFGGKKWVKNSGQMFRLDAQAGISYFDYGPGFLLSGLDGQLPAARHSIQSIKNDINKNLLEPFSLGVNEDWL